MYSPAIMENTTTCPALGHRIKVTRDRRKLTGTQLAAAIGVTDDMVRKYERGERDIPFSRLSLIAATLGVRLATLVKGLDLDDSPR